MSGRSVTSAQGLGSWATAVRCCIARDVTCTPRGPLTPDIGLYRTTPALASDHLICIGPPTPDTGHHLADRFSGLVTEVLEARKSPGGIVVPWIVALYAMIDRQCKSTATCILRRRQGSRGCTAHGLLRGTTGYGLHVR